MYVCLPITPHVSHAQRACRRGGLLAIAGVVTPPERLKTQRTPVSITTVVSLADERSRGDTSVHRIDRPVCWAIEGRSNHMRRHAPT